MKPFAIATIILAALFYSAAGICGELTTSQSAEVEAPAEEVWSLLVDVDNWAEWNPAVDKASLKKGDGEEAGSVVDFKPVIGGKNAPSVKLELDKSEKPGLYEFTSKGPGMNIVFGFTVVEKNGVTTVTSYETITGPGAKGFELMYGRDGLDREHKEWVEAIKKKVESTDEKGGEGE